MPVAPQNQEEEEQSQEAGGGAAFRGLAGGGFSGGLRLEQADATSAPAPGGNFFNNAGQALRNGLAGAGRTFMKAEQAAVSTLSLVGSGVVKLGAVAIFGNGANHAATCVGFDHGQPVWCSDALQKDLCVNAATRSGQCTIYNPPTGYDAEGAVKRTLYLSGKRTNSAGEIVGDKPPTEYTELCAQHVRMGIESGLGHSIQHTGEAHNYGPPLMAAGFTPVASGQGHAMQTALAQNATPSSASHTATAKPTAALSFGKHA